MKKKLLLFIAFSVPLFINVFGQQAFKKNYRFRGSKFKGEKLFFLKERLSTKEIETGYLVGDTYRGKKIYVLKDTMIGNQKVIKESIVDDSINRIRVFSKVTITEIDTVYRKISGIKIKGRITKRSGDTLFISFWDFNKENSDPAYVDKRDNGKKFLYVIGKTKHSEDNQWLHNCGFNRFSVPYRFNMLTALNLPLRYNLKKGEIVTEFLNLNIAYLFMSGRTKFFQKDFLDSRNLSVGFGPYLGITAITNKFDKDKKEAGLTGGITGVLSFHDFNILLAFGVDVGLTNKTERLIPYMGIGFGFNLVDLSPPKTN